jgi:cellulose synthase/poly-beta-1,6-N-acetylglucosamine synthase-like glycosyltransferase/peptidoglycan/xylan/chitin deacetylase (PgdA/CDA1 family)
MGGRRRLVEPHAHWALLGVLTILMMLFLLLSGLVNGEAGEGAQDPSSRAMPGQVPQALKSGGPIVDPSRSDAAGRRVPDRHVVLTFDDGPSKWTEEILDVLAARNVKATFFLVGARAADRPDLVRRMYADGHEVGVHTFTHANLANVSSHRLQLELDQTQLAIAAAIGQTTNLLRLPYSSKPEAVRPADWQAIKNAQNYRIVFTDLDTEDWAKPGVDEIVHAGLPKGDRGAVVMLHDGGGDRSETIAALGELITQLQGRGYTFDTVSSAVNMPPPWHRATTSQRLRGWLLSVVVRTSHLVVWILKLAFAALAILAVLRTLMLIVLARRHVRRPVPLSPARRARLPDVSIVVPAYNEELGIAACVRSLSAADYPNLDIVVVDDGSTDATAAVVAGLALPNVRLVRQHNAGKPAALDYGIRAARHDILVLVDADTILEPDAIGALVAAFGNPDVGAVAGNTKVGNRRGMLGRSQHIEYVMGLNLDRRMFDVLQCMPTVPGAIGAFRREALEDVGGVSDDTLAEDTDLTMAICRAGWRVVYAAEARAWTEAPATLGQVWRQRYRWCYGTMQSMWKHRAAICQSGAAGKLGRRGLPYLLTFQVLLPLLAPVIDLAAAYALVVSSAPPSLLYVWLGFLAMQFLSAAYAFRLDGESLRPLWSLPLQQIAYRQLMYLVVIQSVATALYGLRLRWQATRRTGKLDAVPVQLVAESRRLGAGIAARVWSGPAVD